jgi:hypothetical protein
MVKFILAHTEIVGIILTIIALIWSILQRMILDRKKNAIDMIYDWNNNTSKDTGTIRQKFSGCYELCKIIELDQIEELYYKDLFLDENKRSVRDSVIRLYNYFEYISSAYLSNTASKRIINHSFTITMIRYYVVLENYILEEYLTTKRNPWLPFTKFIEMQIKRSGNRKLCFCTNTNCPLIDKGKIVDNLILLNSKTIDEPGIAGLKEKQKFDERKKTREVEEGTVE